VQAADVALVVLFQLNVLPACAAIEVPAHSQALRVAVRYEPLSVAIDTVSKGGAETGRQAARDGCMHAEEESPGSSKARSAHRHVRKLFVDRWRSVRVVLSLAAVDGDSLAAPLPALVNP
jgi:hypothetical protein